MNGTSTRLLAAALVVAATAGAGAGQGAHAQTSGRHLVTAQRLIGVSAVQNQGGQRLGRIEDVVLERGSDRLAYFVVSVDPGWLKAERLYAIPWEQATVEKGWNTVRFSVSPEQLRRAPGFSPDNWPDMDSPKWQRAMDDVFGASGPRPAKARQLTFRAASRMIGTEVESERNEDLGKVTDILVDDRDGRVAYVVVAQGGVLGAGDNKFPVPWTSFDLRNWKERMVVNATREELQSLVRQPFDVDRLEDSSYTNRVAGVFRGTGPTFQASGTFLDQAVTRISGQIVDVNRPDRATSNDPIRLRVRTDGNREFVVDTAPRSFLDDRIQLVRGREITVTGSLRRIRGGEVLIAKELNVEGGANVAVRDNRGRPLWAGPDFMTGEAGAEAYDEPNRGTIAPRDEDRRDDRPDWRR